LTRLSLAASFQTTYVVILHPHFLAAATGLANTLNSSTRANLALAFQEATLEAVLRALFSLPDSDQRGRIAAMVRYYLSGPGVPISSMALREPNNRSRLLPDGDAASSTLGLIRSTLSSQAGKVRQHQRRIAIYSIFSLPPEIRSPEKYFRMSRFVTNVRRCSSLDTKPPRDSFSGRLISSRSTPPSRIVCAMNSQPIHRSESASSMTFSIGRDYAIRCSKPCASIHPSHILPVRQLLMTSLRVTAFGQERKCGSALGSFIVIVSSGIVRPHSSRIVSRASLRHGQAAARSYHLGRARGSASVRRLAWPKPRSCWRCCCHASRSRSMPRAQCCPSQR